MGVHFCSPYLKVKMQNCIGIFVSLGILLTFSGASPVWDSWGSGNGTWGTMGSGNGTWGTWNSGSGTWDSGNGTWGSWDSGSGTWGSWDSGNGTWGTSGSGNGTWGTVWIHGDLAVEPHENVLILPQKPDLPMNVK